LTNKKNKTRRIKRARLLRRRQQQRLKVSQVVPTPEPKAKVTALLQPLTTRRAKS